MEHTHCKILLNELKTSRKFKMQRFSMLRFTGGLQNECTSFEKLWTVIQSLHATKRLFNGEISYALALLELMQ